MKSAAHVTIRGLSFEASRGTGIAIAGGEGVRVEGCACRGLGNWAVTVNGGRGHAVISCDLEDLGDGGVRLAGGDRQTLAPGGHLARNNHVQRIARWSRCYQPAFLLEGVGHRVEQNLIHDHPHCAILYGGNDHAIERNEIYHVCLETGDVGAIYTGRDWTARGTVIRHNTIPRGGGRPPPHRAPGGALPLLGA